ncbi:hypothetical protein [Bacillus sp. Bos-x628]|uniref:hypothetical protein n=1 Tax=Bacillus maqinnsis TaxID=3229854 RepID=UPI00338FF42E
MSTSKKKWYKKWWVWVIIAVVAVGLGNGLGDSEDSEDTASSSQATKETVDQPKENVSKTNVEEPKEEADTAPKVEKAKKEPKKEEPKKEVKKSTISMAEFDSIENGMTMAEVNKIIGGKGSLLSSAGSGTYETKIYQWDGDAGWGANANVTFQNGKVMAKAQFGLDK